MSSSTSVPAAYYDVLSICRRIDDAQGSVSRNEVHFFAYLSCLLWLYKGNPVATWDYIFALADRKPHSAAIDEALRQLGTLGFIEDNEDLVSVTSSGKSMEIFLASLHQNSERTACIEGACYTLVALPQATIVSALYREPELQAASTLGDQRQLLEGPGVQLIHEQFAKLSEAVGVTASDLMVPAVVWLSFLSQVAPQEGATVQYEG